MCHWEGAYLALTIIDIPAGSRGSAAAPEHPPGVQPGRGRHRGVFAGFGRLAQDRSVRVRP